MKLASIFFVILFLFFGCKSSPEIKYTSSVTPIVIKSIPNPIFYSKSGLKNYFLISKDGSTICVHNDTTYWTPYVDSEIYLSKLEHSDTVIVDTLHFWVQRFGLEQISFRFRNIDYPSGEVLPQFHNQLIISSNKGYESLHLEKKMEIVGFTAALRQVDEKGLTTQLDTILEFESDSMYIYPLIMNRSPVNSYEIEIHKVVLTPKDSSFCFPDRRRYVIDVNKTYSIAQ